jgi:cytoskeletal protein CcmA (bactofilin family)
MGRMLLIVVLGAGIIFSIVSLNINTSNTSMIGNAVEEYENVMAQNCASSGIDFALRNLSDDTTWTGVEGKSLSNGTFTIIVQNTSAKYFNGPAAGITRARLITSIGTYANSVDTVRAVLQLPNPAASSNPPPPFLNYAVCSGSDFSLNGNALITDDNNNSWNANVHTNADFHMNGNNTINGFLTYYSGASSNPAWRLSTAISPNVNPNGDPSSNQVPLITMPSYNPEDYKFLATTVYNSNKTLSGNTILGTKENPDIIYVGGDLTLSGNISGYGILLVKGNINCNGNVTINSIDPSGNNLGLYVKGNLNANGNVNLYAQIYSNSDVNLNGNVKVYGGVTAKGTVHFNGNVSVYYRPTTTELTQPIWPQEGSGLTETRPQIISYFER